MNELVQRPILSICIPTRNRAAILERCLSTLTSLRTFSKSSEIEIVVSDNASSDDTREMCSRFVDRHPDRIKYFKNPTDMKDMNFYLAMSRGSGKFLKLSNDTLLFTEEGLSLILQAVKKNMKTKPLLFFTNGNGHSGETCRECKSIDEFVSEVSFYSTWIGSVGFWKEQLSSLTDFARMSNLQLTQVDAIFRVLSCRAQSVVYNSIFADSIPIKNKGGYSLSRVFGKNYFSILHSYVRNGRLSRRVYQQEKRLMLRRHLLPYFIKTNNGFLGFGYIRDLLWHYILDPVYYIALPVVYIQSLFKFFRRCHRKAHT